MHRYSTIGVIPNNRLYYLEPGAKLSTNVLAALLNSFVFALGCEVFGRVTLGDGVLELTVEDARDYLLVPDLREVTPENKKAITTAFDVLCTRNISNVVEEVKQKDRRTMDTLILTAIGLDPKKYLKPVYTELCELVRERINLGQMRGKARTTKARGERAEKKTVEEVLQEIVPTGPKRFPDEFFSVAAALEQTAEIRLPDEPLFFDNRPMFMAVHIKDGPFSHRVRNPAEGKFLVFAQRAGHKLVRLPAKTVEVARTVANYEKYLRDLKDQLYEAYYRRTLDERTAARLTKAAFGRFRLPDPEL